MSADVLGELVLHPEVEIVPVASFPSDIQSLLGGSESDYVISALNTRLSSQRLGAQAAGFLELFRHPTRLVDAVVAHSRTHKTAPQGVLAEVYPLVRSMRTAGVLVDPREYEVEPSPEVLQRGEMVEDLEILDNLSTVNDTAVYSATDQHGHRVALKRVQANAPSYVRSALANEAAVLGVLGGRDQRIAPRLYRAELDAPSPFLVLEWCDGESLAQTVSYLPAESPRRGALALRLLDAYADLHEAGVIHGDVHAKNLIVAADGSIRLLDFGAGRVRGSKAADSRIGFVPHYEPEAAQALLDGREAPAVSAAGEQYAVAILVYLLLTGHMYLALSLETTVALGQIATQPTRPFSELGLSWPSVETVLRTGLAKTPQDRFDSLRDFERALADAVASERTVARLSQRREPALSGERADARSCSTEAVERLRADYGLRSLLASSGLPRGPTASVFHGAAGVAYALLRVACLHDDAELLSAADVWIERAQLERSQTRAFEGKAIGLRRDAVGPASLFHAHTGIDVVRAAIAAARADSAAVVQSIRSFMTAVKDLEGPTPISAANQNFACDATNGAASLLLGSALLVPLAQADPRVQSELRGRGDELANRVLAELEPRTGDQLANRYLGFAHGRAGAIYALMRWANANRQPVAASVGTHLEDLAAAGGSSSGRGRCWPLERGSSIDRAWSGWCHGSAGHVLTWIEAARALDDEACLTLATAAGRHVWKTRERSAPTLCCGLAGQSMALFELARATESRTWRDRARILAKEAVKCQGGLSNPHSLFQGRVGIELGAAEAGAPASAIFPLCQPLL